MFSGVTIRHCRLGKGESEAGIINDGGVVTVFNSIVSGNTDGPGLDCFGGGFMTGNHGSTTVDHSIITDNLAYYEIIIGLIQRLGSRLTTVVSVLRMHYIQVALELMQGIRIHQEPV